jgi:hypothetical protein
MSGFLGLLIELVQLMSNSYSTYLEKNDKMHTIRHTCRGGHGIVLEKNQ